MPYGRIISKSSYLALLNFEKKVLVNTGVSENQSQVEAMLSMAGLNFQDIDYVINMDSSPEHIGLNAIIQYRNPKALFFAHPAEIPYIEDTVKQHEERYIPGFYKLVSGNTANVKPLEHGMQINLGDESLSVSTSGGRLSLYLNDSQLTIEADEIRKENGAAAEHPAIRKAG
jgi:glyoxylase-like metal-dependent hydrolase (beta-lactamase superfamily II)